MKLANLNMLKEGGNATSKWETRRVNKKDIPPTITYVSKISGIPRKDLHAIGSVGKVSSSGDIDLAVDANEYDPEELHKKMMSVLDNEGVYNKSTKVASYAVPIKGDPSKGKVQVDFMYASSVNWAKFAYHSEGEGSRYKGAIRAILLSSVAAAINEPGTDHFEFDGDDLIIRAGRTVDLSAGLRRIFQHRPKNKKGDRYLKTMKAIPIEDFKEMFPNVEVKGGQSIIDDPEKVVKILFGSSAKPSDVNTAEQLIALIKKKFDEETQKKIFKIAGMRAKPLIGKMKIPGEMLLDNK